MNTLVVKAEVEVSFALIPFENFGGIGFDSR